MAGEKTANDNFKPKNSNFWQILPSSKNDGDFLIKYYNAETGEQVSSITTTPAQMVEKVKQLNTIV